MRSRRGRLAGALLACGLAAALLTVTVSMALLAPVETAHRGHHAPGSAPHQSSGHAGTDCCDLCAAHCGPAVPATQEAVDVAIVAAPRPARCLLVGTAPAPAPLRHRFPPAQAPPALLG
jgi:hypothetical protein